MNKNLPKVYASPINKLINNNKDVFYSTENIPKTPSNLNIPQKINQIFANPHHVYKSNVHIKTLDNDLETTIVGKTSTNLLTLNGEKIPLNDIVDIERI